MHTDIYSNIYCYRCLECKKMHRMNYIKFLTQICILLEDEREVTKPGVAQSKFLVSVFSLRTNCKQ